jgi:peroxiredoxin
VSVRVLAGLLVVAAACAAGPGGAGGHGRAADFALRDVDGRTVRLSDYLGKDVILINFWATWCAPCAGELPHLERIYEAYRARGFVVLSVAMDGPESVAAVGPQARRYGLQFPVLLDEETRVVGAYNPKRAAPFSVLIGKDGVVASTHEGYSSGDEVELEKNIAQLLGMGG